MSEEPSGTVEEDAQKAPEGGPDDQAPASTEPEDKGSQFDPEKYVEKQRYEDLRAEFNRRNPDHELVEQLRDPETSEATLREIAQHFGYSLAELEEALEDEEENENRDPRVDELLAERDEQRESQYLDDLERHVDSEIGSLVKAAGLEFADDEEKSNFFDVVYGALTPNEEGTEPDVERAFKKVTGLRDSAIKGYVAGKRRAPQAPNGSSAQQKPDLDNPEQRRAWMAEQLSAREG